jgi:hypothetical protein
MVGRAKITPMREPANEAVFDQETFSYKPSKRVMTVWLIDIRQKKWNMYWCPDCRSPIAQYLGDLVMEHPGFDVNSATSLPTMIQCKNPQCGRKVIFQSVVTRNK